MVSLDKLSLYARFLRIFNVLFLIIIILTPFIHISPLTNLTDKLFLTTRWKMFAPNPPHYNLKYKVKLNNQLKEYNLCEVLNAPTENSCKKIEMFSQRGLLGPHKDKNRKDLFDFIKRKHSPEKLEIKVIFENIKTKKRTIL